MGVVHETPSELAMAVSSTAPSTLLSPIGPLDREYLGIVATGADIYVTDRFGRGGAHRFRDGRGTAQVVLEEGVRAWLVAVNEPRVSLATPAASWA